MKKFLFFLVLTIFSLPSIAQSTSNADGTIKHRGNVAIIATYNVYSFNHGIYKKEVDDNITEQMSNSYYSTAMQLFGNSGFGIVNRDNDVYRNVKKMLEEQKLEDYMDGFSVQAKGEGADYLCLIDGTMLVEKNYGQMFMSCRIIDIANNTGYHFSRKSRPCNIADPVAMTQETRLFIDDFRSSLYNHILEVFPEQYAIIKAQGKNLYLAGFQPNGRILNTDKFYAFKYYYENLESDKLTVMQPLAVAKWKGVEEGMFLVESDKKITPSDDIVLFRNLKHLRNVGGAMFVSFFPFAYQPDSYEGFIKKRVNNAIYDALTKHPGYRIVEQEFLPELKKERELQKTEEFMEGHTIEQMKAIGAMTLMHLEDFKISGTQVSFKLNIVSVKENRIDRTVEVVSSIDNIEDEMYKQICERIMIPCKVNQHDKKIVNVSLPWSLGEDEKFIIQLNKQIKNSITNEISYTLIPVCKCSVTEPMGNKITAKVEEIINKEEFNSILQHSNEGSLFIRLDGSDIKSNISTESDIEIAVKKQEKKEEKKEKRAKTISVLGKIGSTLLEHTNFESH